MVQVIKIGAGSKYKLTDSEKKEIARKKRNAHAIKYQQNSEHYKEYKRNAWRKKVFDKMEAYIDKYTSDDIYDIMDEDDDVTELRNKFKSLYGHKIYYKYVSPSLNKPYKPQTEEQRQIAQQRHRQKIYNKLVSYINKYTDDDENDLFDDEDDVAELRKKFKNKYGLKIYKKYIAE